MPLPSTITPIFRIEFMGIEIDMTGFHLGRKLTISHDKFMFWHWPLLDRLFLLMSEFFIVFCVIFWIEQIIGDRVQVVPCCQLCPWCEFAFH